MQQRTFTMSRSAGLLVGAAAVLALLPAVSQALAIGDLRLQSALSEPFRAEIELGSVDLKDLKTLKASLVTRPDFAVGGIPRGAPITRQLGVRIASEPDGRHLLKLHSEQPIREPYVRFLLQLDWAGGRLTREFTALLDPREPALESDAAAPGAQTLPNTDTQTPATEQALSAAGTAAAESAPAMPQALAQAVPSADTTDAKQIPVRPAEADRSVGSKPKESASVQAQREPTKSDQTTPVSASNEQLRLASEIKTWAQSRTRSQADAEVSETDAAESQRGAGLQQTPLTATTATEIRRKIAERARANVPASGQRQTTLRGWIGAHNRELLMAFVALLALLLAGAGTAWLMLTWQHQPSPGVNPHPANQAATDLVEQRQRGGRRRQFVPVAIERRRGPRRQSDLPQPVLTPIDASEATGDAYPDDSVERALKDAISKYPTRHGLKLKLLALYHTRNDKAAFETLLNSMYAAIESNSAAGEQNWPRFEDYDDLPDSGDAASLTLSFDEPPPDRAEPDMGDIKAPKKLPRTPDDNKHDQDLSVPTLYELEVPEYPLFLDEHTPAGVNKGLPDLDSAFSEYQPAAIEKLDVDPLQEINNGATGDVGIEVLHVDDLADIRQIVEHGMEIVEGQNADKQGEASAKPRASKKGGKRKRKTKASLQNKELSADAHAKGRQWRDPATKIDLAKAYIDMGDPERARHILDELLEHWHRDDGTDR